MNPLQPYLRVLQKLPADVRRVRPIAVSGLQAWLFSLACKLSPFRNLSFPFRAGSHGFRARPADFGALEEILLEQEYDIAAKLLTQGASQPTVIDGGANIGLFSLAMLQAQPAAVVHSLEPEAHTFQILQRNVQQNPRLRWQAHPLALWKSSGPLKFGATEASTSSRIYDLAPAGRMEMVQAVTLTEFAAQHAPGEITLLKLDIEGAEEAVLVECEALLKRVQHLVLEIHPPRSDQAHVMEILRSHFPYIHSIPGRSSSKPLVLASRTQVQFPK